MQKRSRMYICETKCVFVCVFRECSCKYVHICIYVGIRRTGARRSRLCIFTYIYTHHYSYVHTEICLKSYMYNHDCMFVNTYVFIYVCAQRTSARRSQLYTLYTYIHYIHTYIQSLYISCIQSALYIYIHTHIICKYIIMHTCTHEDECRRSQSCIFTYIHM